MNDCILQFITTVFQTLLLGIFVIVYKFKKKSEYTIVLKPPPSPFRKSVCSRILDLIETVLRCPEKVPL